MGTTASLRRETNLRHREDPRSHPSRRSASADGIRCRVIILFSALTLRSNVKAMCGSVNDYTTPDARTESYDAQFAHQDVARDAMFRMRAKCGGCMTRRLLQWSLAVAASLVATGCFREVVAYDQTKESARQVAVVLQEQDVSVEVIEQGTSAGHCFVVSVDSDDAVRAYRVLVDHNLPQGQPECVVSTATVSTKVPVAVPRAR